MRNAQHGQIGALVECINMVETHVWRLLEEWASLLKKCAVAIERIDHVRMTATFVCSLAP
jgi:hypothetical protein